MARTRRATRSSTKHSAQNKHPAPQRQQPPQQKRGSSANHKHWTEFQSRVLAQLPSGVPPASEKEWKEFQRRVLAQLRPALQPENEEEWAQFRDHALAQMLVRRWRDAVYASHIMEGTWTEVEKQLSPAFQPMILKDIEVEYKLRFKQDYTACQDPLTFPRERLEIHREMWEKQMAWTTATKEQAGRMKRKEASRELCESNPESRPELLMAVQIETEWEQEEAKWRQRIKARLPAAHWPTNTQEWMKLDCRILAQMPFQPRLNSAMQLNAEWQAKEDQWEEWEKLTAWKLLARYPARIEKWEQELYSEEHNPTLPVKIELEIEEDRKQREWSNRIFAQLPPGLRPANPEEWFPLVCWMQRRAIHRVRILDSALEPCPEWKAREVEWEDWEKLMACQFNAAAEASNENSRMFCELHNLHQETEPRKSRRLIDQRRERARGEAAENLRRERAMNAQGMGLMGDTGCIPMLWDEAVSMYPQQSDVF